MANLKYFNGTTGEWEEIKVSTKFTELLNTEVLTQDQNYANIGITSFNPNEDVLFSILNSTWLQKDQDYIINGGLLRIESKDGSNWSDGDTFNFVVLKNVDKDSLPTTDASLLQDGSITIAKLATSIQDYITKIGVSVLTTSSDNVSDAINELDAGLLAKSNQNEIINGNFDHWQRGVSITDPANGTYLADRFLMGHAATVLPTSLTHSRQVLTTGDIDNAYYFYRIGATNSGTFDTGNIAYVTQSIENGVRKLSGSNKKITISFYARSSIANKKIGVALSENYGSGGTPSTVEWANGTYFNLTSSWIKYKWTFSLKSILGKTFGTNNDDFIKILFMYAYGTTYAPMVGDTVAESFGGAGTIDIAQVKLEAGDKATPFVPRPIGEELSLCQRYYETINTNNTVIKSSIISTCIDGVQYKTIKRSTPTVTITSESGVTGKVRDIGAQTEYSVSIPYNSVHGFRQLNAAGAPIGLYSYSYASDAEIY